MSIRLRAVGVFYPGQGVVISQVKPKPMTFSYTIKHILGGVSPHTEREMA